MDPPLLPLRQCNSAPEPGVRSPEQLYVSLNQDDNFLILLQEGTLQLHNALKSQLNLYFFHLYCSMLARNVLTTEKKIFKQEKSDHRLTLQGCQGILFWVFFGILHMRTGKVNRECSL